MFVVNTFDSAITVRYTFNSFFNFEEKQILNLLSLKISSISKRSVFFNSNLFFNYYFFFFSKKKCLLKFSNKYKFFSKKKKKSFFFLITKTVKKINNNIILYFQKNYAKKNNKSFKNFSNNFNKTIKSFNTNNIISKSFKFFNNLLWFFFFFKNLKDLLFFVLKSCFFDFIFRNSDLRNKISLLFYEPADLKFLTSAIISNYIIRNLKVGNTLIKIISPLLAHLEKSRFVYHGWKIGCSGRFQRRGRAQHLWFGKKGVPLNTIVSCVDFFKSTVRLRNGLCCIKVFIVKTNIFVYLF